MNFVNIRVSKAQLESIIEAMENVDIHHKDFTTEQYMHYAMTIDKLDQALDAFKDTDDE
jgi:hypothetical protein